MLLGRTGAYKALAKALMQNNQTGAVRILIEGIPNEPFSKALTYLGISINWDGFENIDIELHGKVYKLHEFFPAANYERIRQIFKDTLTEVEIYDTFVKKQNIFVLVKNTIPARPSFYIPRFLSNQIKVEKFIFKEDCSDVFVFKNTIARPELTEIAKPYLTSSSSSQLSCITSRFIYLDENEDWIHLKRSAKVPIHLINYDTNRKKFLLEDSTAISKLQKKLGSQQQRAYISESDFVRHQLSSNAKPSSVCICDTTGMGKTLLLTNIARRMKQKCLNRIIGYIPLSTLATVFSSPWSNNSINQAVFCIFKHISPSYNHANLVFKLLKARITQGELFFDGFDAIPSDEVERTNQILHFILKELPNVRIYIATRPHMCQELEKTLGVIAYNILPFNLQNQVECLVRTWSKVAPNSDPTLLHNFAIKCLEEVNISLNTNDKMIAGIPLLCQLIAQVAFCAIQENRIATSHLNYIKCMKHSFNRELAMSWKHRKNLMILN